MANVVCYKTKTKRYGNDEYLAYYSYKTVEEIEREVEELNTNKPATLWNGVAIDWNNVAYFFIDKQEEMY